MARMLAAFRNGRFTREEIKTMRPTVESFTKPMLIDVLRQVQNLQPPRMAQQSKATLVNCVRRGLYQPDGSPVRLAVQQAMASVRQQYT